MKIGILGGGQLGRMMFQETIGLDLDLSFLDTSRSFPVGKIAHSFTEGDFTNYDDVMAFAKNMDVISIEIEKVNLKALYDLETQGKKIHPKPSSLEIIQDKGLQKEFYRKHSIPTSDFKLYNSKEEVLSAIENGQVNYPFVQKTRKDGYDGKGVAIVHLEANLDKLLDGPCLIEPLVPIFKELAVIACRNERGECITYEVVEMVFDQEANLVKYLFSPAEILESTSETCRNIAESLIELLDICGLLAVEFFMDKKGEILVNEVAPRPHNSGHHTIDAAVCSQFENHIRAISNLPLGSTSQYKMGAMINILGEEGFTGQKKYMGLEDVLKLEDVHVHLYGKKITKPKRKMGHINVLGDSKEEIEDKINTIDKFFKVIA